ncbi:uncharacterized protein [Misgurnus anguillicaudatus]|uniref:uncharacterized protein n=1 Tax=Misgurnus anguillicaudatus TaxID=75329 RepID=UPI003CCF8E19
MIYLFTFFLLLLRTSCVFSWSAGKCIFYDDVEEFPVDRSCIGKPNTAFCSPVTDIKEDLCGLPSNLQNLCIHMDRDMEYVGVFAPGSFSRFFSLKYIEIHGCFYKISPKAFTGLLNLELLHLSSTFEKGCCEVAVDFSGLPSLKTLSLPQYNLSLMAPNVFDTIPQLENLGIYEMCLKDLSEIVCRLRNLKSLKLLYLNDHDLNSLRFPNCSIYNTSNSNTSTVYNIENVHLILGSIEHIDEGALKNFAHLSELYFGFRSDFLRDLSMTGVNKIYSLRFSVDVLNIDELCYAAKLYSIKSIYASFQTINLPAMFTNISEDCKEIVDITLKLDRSFKIVPLDINLIFQFFRNLSTFYLIEQVLRSNDFKSLCLTNPQLVEQLSIMRLNSNNISKIISHQFMCFKNLERLELNSNNISGIEDFAFSGLDKLKDLDLSGNKLSYIYQDTFSGLYELMVLNLQVNPIIQIKSNSFGHLINLHTLLLGDLKFSPNMSQVKLHLSDIFGSVPYNLSHVSISSGSKPMRLIIGNITLNQSLALQIKGQYVTVEDCDSPLLSSVVTLQIIAEYVICGKEFIGKYVKSVVSLEFRSTFSDNIGDLAVINQLVHLKTLKLENTDLSKQPNVPIMFHNLTKLRTLILANCRIFFLDGSLTKDLKALISMLFVPWNDVKILQTFVEHLTSLKYLQLEGLRLHCSCDNAWLISWMMNNRQVQVFVVIPTMEELQCLSNNGVDNLNFVHYTQENCSFDIDFVLFASTSAFLYLFMFVALSYQFVGKYIMPLFYIASGWFREALRMDAKRQYRYDVFISYSSKDERWVMEKLLPNLEQRGPPFLRLCLHGRDFQLGQDIVENITDSIYASRRTLCLVSRNFLRSTWCTLEMQLGTYRLQVEQRDILILVFLEKIPSRLLSYNHRLARHVKTMTYIDWTLDIEKHDEFWDRLWCKLSSDKSN